MHIACPTIESKSRCGSSELNWHSNSNSPDTFSRPASEVRISASGPSAECTVQMRFSEVRAI